MFVEMDDKRFFLERFIHDNPESKIIVFVRTRVRADRVVKAMGRVNIPALAIHGDKDQSDRTEVMKLFKSGQARLLVATDVSARGIDIPDVNYVINYDLPEKTENYVHRVGRTGRGVRLGVALSFCSNEEKPRLEEIQELLNKPVEVLKVTKKEYALTIDPTMAVSQLGALISPDEIRPKKKKEKKKRDKKSSKKRSNRKNAKN